MSRFSVTYTAALAIALGQTAIAETAEMQVNGASLTYVSEGEGVPVVFVHGAISDLRAWEAYGPIISDEGRFVAYSQRYFGTGDWPDDATNFQRTTHVSDLIAFVEGLDAGPVHLVTWSYSGEIGVHAMLDRPDLFRSAVHYEPVLDNLVSGAPGGANATRDLFSHFGPAVMAAQEDRPEDAALRFIEAVFELPEGGAETEPAQEMWRQNGRTVAPYLAMDPPPSLDCDALGAITAPTLVVQGAQSFTRFSIMADLVAACVENGMTVMLPEVNHGGPYRAPDKFSAVIEGFLSIVE